VYLLYIVTHPLRFNP